MGVGDRDEERAELSRLGALKETARFIERAGDLTSLEEIEELAPFAVVSD